MEGNGAVNGRSDGRRPDGRFSAGNRAGLGNANNRRMQALRSALLDVISPEAIREMATTYLGMARGGDLEAGKVLLAYLIPKPPASLEVSGPDGGDLLGLGEVRVAILKALAPFGSDAQIAVAAALLELGRDRAAAEEGP